MERYTPSDYIPSHGPKDYINMLSLFPYDFHLIVVEDYPMKLRKLKLLLRYIP